jgi:hypothetical protein
LNEQTDDTSTDIALYIFCGKHTFKKDRKLHKIKTAERLQNVKGATEGDRMLLHAIHADKIKQYVIKIYFITNFDMLTYSKIAIDHASHLLLHTNMAL